VLVRGVSSGVVLGSHSVKVCQLRKTGTVLELLGLAAYGRQSLGADGEMTEQSFRQLGQMLAQSRISIRNGTLGIAGKDLMLRFFSTPPMPPAKLEQALAFEVGEVTGSQEDVSFGYKLLNLPRKELSEFTVLAGIARNRFLEDIVAKLRLAKVSIKRISPEGYALYEVFRRCTEPTDEYSLLLDVGAEKTEMVIVWNGNLVFARSVAPGGREFSRAVMEVRGVELGAAEEIKRRQGAIKTDDEMRSEDPKDREMTQALTTVAHRLSAAINSSVMFCKAQTKLTDMDIGRIYLSGGGARLKGLDEFFHRSLHKPVEYLDPFSLVKVSGSSGGEQDILSLPTPFAVPLGLALLGYEETALEVTPPRVRKSREFWQRKVYCYAAIPLFAAGIGVLAALSLHNYGVLVSNQAAAAKAVAAAKDEQKKAEQLRKEYDDCLNRLAVLKEKTDLGAWLQEVLAGLRRVTPDDITCSAIELRAAMPQQAPHIVIRGTAQKLAVATSRPPSKAIEEFIALLQKENLCTVCERVSTVADATGNTYQFELRLYRYRSFANRQAAQRALKEGKVKPDDFVYVNGVLFVARNVEG